MSFRHALWICVGIWKSISCNFRIKELLQFYLLSFECVGVQENRCNTRCMTRQILEFDWRSMRMCFPIQVLLQRCRDYLRQFISSSHKLKVEIYTAGAAIIYDHVLTPIYYPWKPFPSRYYFLHLFQCRASRANRKSIGNVPYATRLFNWIMSSRKSL